MARRRHDRLLLRLVLGTLVVLALMHPNTVSHIAQLAMTVVLAIVDGTAQAAAQQPGPAAIAALGVYVAHQIRTHRPRTARAHA